MNPPAEILPFLWLGGAAGRTDAMLTEKGVTLVINATSGCADTKKCCVKQMMVDCEDMPGYYLKQHFEDVAVIIRQEKEKNGKVFLHCIAGVSRSSSLILAYLMRYEDMTLLDAFELVKSKRSIIRPRPCFWGQLVEYEKELRGSNTVTMVKIGKSLDASVYEEK